MLAVVSAKSSFLLNLYVKNRETAKKFLFSKFAESIRLLPV